MFAAISLKFTKKHIDKKNGNIYTDLVCISMPADVILMQGAHGNRYPLIAIRLQRAILQTGGETECQHLTS